jgi:lysophospholipase L1-like esterase/predicted amino acid racemase
MPYTSNQGTQIIQTDNKEIKEQLADVTTSLAEKASKDEVRLKSVKNELEDMSPTVLAAIEGGEGTSFNLLSIPQNGSVGDEKTTFITIGENIFDASKTTDNKYIDNTGNENSSATLCYSDYIPVNPGDVLTISRALTSPGATYDQNKNRIGVPYTVGAATSPYTFTVPDEVYSLRLNLYMEGGNSKSVFMVVKGSSLPGAYVPYKKFIPKLVVTNDNLENDSVSTDKITHESVTTEKIAPESVTAEKIKGSKFDNMFDKTTVTADKYVDNTGVINDSALLCLSDYIPVTEFESFTVTKGYTSQGGYYDVNENWIAKIDGAESGVIDGLTFTVPSNRAYVRLNIQNNHVDEWMMVPGDTLPETYSSFGWSVDGLKGKKELVTYSDLDANLKGEIDSIGVFSSKWAGKKIVTFGTSISWYDGQQYNANTTEPGVTVKGYQSFIREKLGVIVDNQGVSGNTTPQINTRIQVYDFTGVDAVIMEAGTNDFRDMSTEQIGTIEPIGSAFDNTTFIGAYQEAIEHILGENPEIKIFLFAPIKGWKDGIGIMPETYPQAVMDIGKLYSLSVCNLYYDSGINDLTKSVYIVDTDAVSFDFHPSTKGYERMANIILPFLENH